MTTIKRNRLEQTKRLVAALAWTALFLYSAYLLLHKLFRSESYTVIHIVVPFALLLVSIRAIRRYLIRRNLEQV